jgi:ribonuclease-3
MSDTQKFSANPYNNRNFLINESNVKDIMNLFGIHDFKPNNINLYQTAFIHKSYCPMKDYEDYINNDNSLPLQLESYEKMEFLGDSILGYIVCKYIYQRYTLIYNKDEGFLTKLKNRLVCGEMLAQLSKNLGFDKFIVISKHIEDNCDGRNNKNILEDVFEAFIGALYLDKGDIQLIDTFLINIYEMFVDFGEIILVDTNYKDQISRYFQNTFNIYPKYEIIKTDTHYSCNLYKDSEIVSNGDGTTKKGAEQDASKNALLKYGVLN